MKYILLTIAFLFFSVSPASAQVIQTDWVITNFHSDIIIQEQGSIMVTETIDVDFKDLQKHGIYRDIPITYEDKQGNKTYTEIQILFVKQDNQSAEIAPTNNENNLRIRIGDPDQEITGRHTYQIRYLAKGVLRSFTDYDELYWNVTGNAWEADIQKASATVTFPQEGITKTVCFEGYPGYTNPCAMTDETSTSVLFTATRYLPPTQGLTIVVNYTKGIVPILTVAAPKRIQDDLFTKTAFATFLITLIAGLFFITFLWIKRGRDLWFRTRRLLDPNTRHETMPLWAHETTVVEFEPPHKLRPAEIGVLMDERADTLDITSTLIDLAHRGFLTIKEFEKKWLFGSKDYELHRTAVPNEKLLGYEKLLLERLFATGKSIKVSELKTTFYDDLALVKKKLYAEMMHKKLFVADPDSTRTKYLLLGFAMIGIGGLLTFLGFQWISGQFVAASIAIILCGIIMLFTSNTMPRRTALGREYYQQAKGYYLFISGAEKYRQRFFEKKDLFNDILPYAIVFGLTGKFAKAMKDIGITPPQTTWYTGTHVFVASTFASDMNDFSKSLSAAIASTPSSSGSSGGSSGGGFGGGGGGSW